MAKKSDKSADKKKLPMGFREYKGGLQYRFVVEGKRYSVYGSTIKECRAKELQKRGAENADDPAAKIAEIIADAKQKHDAAKSALSQAEDRVRQAENAENRVKALQQEDEKLNAQADNEVYPLSRTTLNFRGVI